MGCAESKSDLLVIEKYAAQLKDTRVTAAMDILARASLCSLQQQLVSIRASHSCDSRLPLNVKTLGASDCALQWIDGASV